MSSSSIPSQSICCLTPTATTLTMHEIKQGQGITSILSPTKSIPSLRRTLSADTSSRDWLPRNGLPPKGPGHLPQVEDSSSDEEEGSRVKIWNLIQEDKRKAIPRDMQLGEFDIWDSITSRNEFRRSGSETIPPQYVHPLVRRSSSCLSEKSLEICTESLGSETGSDGFSSFSPSEMRCLFSPQENEHGKNESFFSSAFHRTVGVHDFYAKRSSHAQAAIWTHKQGPRSFPPPLPFLSQAADGASLRMQSRRVNGHLVLEAVSIPSQKNFQARRENGRLMLAVTDPDVEPCNRNLIRNGSTEEQEAMDEVVEGCREAVDEVVEGCREAVDEVEEGCRDHGDEIVEKEGASEERIEWIISKNTPPRFGCIKKLQIPKIAIMMNKPDVVSELVFFQGINEGEVEINSVPIVGSRAATATNPLNMYEYFWRTNPGTTAKAVTDLGEMTQPPLTLKSYRNTKKYVISHNDRDSASNDRQELQILFKDYSKNIGEDCWVSVMKDSRRSLFFLEPRCIATS